ncbi:unnamed protein product [Ascophyllum nodosum]
MDNSASPGATKRKEVDGASADDSSGSQRRLKRQLTQESDLKVYEKNIHDTMKSLPAQRERRKKDYERVMTLFSTENHARDRRNKVFEFFNREVTKDNCYQSKEMFAVSQELLSVLDEARETLELLVNWCDLCLPANEQSFAEANRIKIQDFEEYLASVLQSVVSATGEVNAQLEKRADMLRSLFSTKDVLPGNYEGWSRMHRDMLVHIETNSHLHASKTWEKVVEVSARDYLLLYNYWKTNLKDNTIVFQTDGKEGTGNYFG